MERPEAVGESLECKRPDEKTPGLDVEYALLARYDTVIGMDEVGRGAIAGPVAVGAQVFTLASGDVPDGLKDSKLLTEKRRVALEPAVKAWGIGAVGYGSAPEIDRYGITEMLGEAGFRALASLAEQGVDLSRAVVLLDGSHDWLSPLLEGRPEVVTRVGADRACASVAAASVRAKVARDSLMQRHAAEFPHYSWETNKGYGSKKHYEGIANYGVTELHRKTWIKGER